MIEMESQENFDASEVVAKHQLLTIEELADLLQVKRSWLYDRTRKSKTNGFPVVRVGKYVRFNYLKVLEWLEKGNG